MKITLLNTSDSLGGAAIAAYRAAEALRRQNDSEVSFLVKEQTRGDDWIQGKSTNFLNKQYGFLTFVAERLRFLPLEASPDIRFSFSLGNTGFRVVQHPFIKNADILHLHWINKGFLSLDEIGKLTELGKPVFWTLHDMWAFTGGCHHSRGCFHFQQNCGNCQYVKKPSDSDISASILAKKKKKFNPKNLVIITPSHWLSELAESSSLFSHVPVYTIPNPIDTDFFAPRPKKKSQEILGLDPTKKYILFAAATISQYYKGFAYLNEALEILSNQYTGIEKEWELLVVGNNKTGVELAPKFKKHYLGYISDMSQMITVYNAANVFVTPSLEENLPNTIMEAMACGTPSVGFNIGGIPEMIEHKENGYIAEFKNTQDFANGIFYILSDENRYESFCKKVRQKAVETYSYGVFAERLKALYNEKISK
jgi:glycosyltransferase involved in cell wall biosynthesis